MANPTFDDLMDVSVAGLDLTGNTVAASAVLKSNYDVLVAHRNLRTYSTAEVLHACPRKYQLKKMQAAHGSSERVNSTTFAFGHAVGAGVATLDATQDIRRAVFDAFIAWDMDLFADERKQGRKHGKSFHEAIWALYVYQTFCEEETDLADYEVIGIEQTVAVDFEDGHYFSGHIDELLRNKITGSIRVKENKTTGFSNIDPALYSNSDQALGYSVVVENYGVSEYEVMYVVYSSTEQKWTQFNFVKPTYKRAEWIQDQLLINQQIDHYAELNFFPKRGGSCFDFMRRCEYYETCDISTKSAFGAEFADLPSISSIADIAAVEAVNYSVSLSSLVAKQKEKSNQS